VTNGPDVGSIVRVVEDRRGNRRVKDNAALPFAIVFGVIGGALLYVGLSGKVPEFMYWPPTAPTFDTN
jgi:hypothetical protein